jgi:hypothetical protein
MEEKPMRMRSLISLMLSLSIALVSGCGSDDSGGTSSVIPVDTNAPATLTLTPSKGIALADGADAVTIRAEVMKADRTPAADGTVVTFSVPADSGTLSTSTAVSAAGLAVVTLTRAPVSGAKNQTITVTGAAGSATGTAQAKFINQPASADVFISLDQNVTNLAALNIKVINTPGVSFDNTVQPIAAINAASGSSVVNNFNAQANVNNIAMINAAANGCSTGTAPIIKATFAVAAGNGLPAFGIDPAPASFTATNSSNGATSPSINTANVVVTVKYDTE